MTIRLANGIRSLGLSSSTCHRSVTDTLAAGPAPIEIGSPPCTRDDPRSVPGDSGWEPHPVRGLIGANILLAHADGGLGREALAALDFYAHADLFINPTAELADVVLPVASAFDPRGDHLGSG